MDLSAGRARLVQRAGGWLRNPVRLNRITCSVCSTPCPGHNRCYRCHSHRPPPGLRLADRVAAMTYARAGHQSGFVMRAYKAPDPPRDAEEVVALLALVGLRGHLDCAGLIAGAPVTHWAAIPSLPPNPGRHRLHRIVDGTLDLPEIPLVASHDVDDARDLSVDHFRAPVRVPAGGHVLLVDDTWVSGGHAQSAVLALRTSGAAEVSVITLARWLADNADTKRLLSEFLLGDYDPSLCPWTGAECPRFRG